MLVTSEAIESLVEEFSRLPTIGRKTARRLASYVLKMPRAEVEGLSKALIAVKDKVIECETCMNVTDESPCAICISTKRDQGLICVVEEPSDVMAIERSNEFKGVYHVLGGAISPLDGIGPDDLKIAELIKRARSKVWNSENSDDSSLQDNEGQIQEIILALNPNLEGDTTSHYIAGLLSPFGIKITRIARGLPVGGDLEFADEATLGRALAGRRSID